MYVLLDLYKQVLKFNLICIKTVLGYVENLKYLRAVTNCKLYLISSFNYSNIQNIKIKQLLTERIIITTSCLHVQAKYRILYISNLVILNHIFVHCH